MNTKTFMDAVEQCEEESTQEGKLRAISGIQKHHRRLIHEALNKHRRFHVKQIVMPKKFAKKDYPIMIPFYELLDHLASSLVTGHSARDSITITLAKYTKRTAGFLARVLRKDLDCGAEAKTWLKVYPELDLPNFKVMLAKKLDEEKHPFDWDKEWIAQCKYDGLRLIAIVNDGEVSYYSRDGRPASFCNGLFDDEMKSIEEYVGEPVVLDGEVLGDSFQDSTQAKGKKNMEQRKRLRFYAFDIMNLTEWNNRHCPLIQSLRTKRLNMLLDQAGTKKIIPVDSKHVYSKKEAQKFFNEVVKHGKAGQDEGLILKNPHGCYEWDRSKNWIKWKPVYTYDLVIVGFEAGRGKYEGSLGAFLCEGEDENGNKIEASVGGGYTDKQRDEFWKRRHQMIGETLECECGKVTRAKNSDTLSLRFPVFSQIRGDK